MRTKTAALILAISAAALVAAIILATRPNTLLWADNPTPTPSSMTYILPEY